MTLISLKPITITFTETCKISVEDYLEWCNDYEFGFENGWENHQESVYLNSSYPTGDPQ